MLTLTRDKPAGPLGHGFRNVVVIDYPGYDPVTVYVHADPDHPGRVRLSFDGPAECTVLRGELVGRRAAALRAEGGGA